MFISRKENFNCKIIEFCQNANSKYHTICKKPANEKTKKIYTALYIRCATTKDRLTRELLLIAKAIVDLEDKINQVLNPNIHTFDHKHQVFRTSQNPNLRYKRGLGTLISLGVSMETGEAITKLKDNQEKLINQMVFVNHTLMDYQNEFDDIRKQMQTVKDDIKLAVDYAVLSADLERVEDNIRLGLNKLANHIKYVTHIIDSLIERRVTSKLIGFNELAEIDTLLHQNDIRANIMKDYDLFHAMIKIRKSQ